MKSTLPFFSHTVYKGHEAISNNLERFSKVSTCFRTIHTKFEVEVASTSFNRYLGPRGTGS